MPCYCSSSFQIGALLWNNWSSNTRSSYSWTDWICLSLGKQHVHHYFIFLLFQRPFLSQGIQCHTADPSILPCHRGSPRLVHLAHWWKSSHWSSQGKEQTAELCTQLSLTSDQQTRSIHWETQYTGNKFGLAYTYVILAPKSSLHRTQSYAGGQCFPGEATHFVSAFPEKTRKPEKALSS